MPAGNVHFISVLVSNCRMPSTIHLPPYDDIKTMHLRTMRPPGASFAMSFSGIVAAAAPTWMASYCAPSSCNFVN